MLEIVERRGREDIATVRIARLEDGNLVEFVDSVQPPLTRREKWVLIVSTLKGCPIRCPICDAGGRYGGRLSAGEILAQIDEMVLERFPDGEVPVERLKVQFARMGDPALNPAVLDVLEELPRRYATPCLTPCISTVAPAGCDGFMERLTVIKRRLYSGGRFQMQLSLHTSCEERRRELVPSKTWSYRRMAGWGDRFMEEGDRKVTLNFAPVRGFPLDAEAIADIFEPDRYFIKLTPVNPTSSALSSGLAGLVDPDCPEVCEALAAEFSEAGFETLVSIGELEENSIGSNCGMYLSALEDRSVQCAVKQ